MLSLLTYNRKTEKTQSVRACKCNFDNKYFTKHVLHKEMNLPNILSLVQICPQTQNGNLYFLSCCDPGAGADQSKCKHNMANSLG